MKFCHYCDWIILWGGVLGEYSRTATNRPAGKHYFHKMCFKKAIKKQAEWWEKLDENCNDCKFFEAIRWAKSEEANKFFKENRKYGFFPPIDVRCREGICKLKNEKVYGIPQTFLGMECFKHRNEKTN